MILAILIVKIFKIIELKVDCHPVLRAILEFFFFILQRVIFHLNETEHWGGWGKVVLFVEPGLISHNLVL